MSTDNVYVEARVRLLPPQDAMQTLRTIAQPVQTTILDPWYNRGVGGLQDGYDDWLAELLAAASDVSQHVFVWGFPDIVYRLMDRIPRGMQFVAWLTWYYKNCPTVIRGWRSAQLTCLHFSRIDAKLHFEYFLNDIQKEKLAAGKLRYMPGPPTVFEVPLNIGFVGRSEQTGHPAQKPIAVIEPLIGMTTVEGDTVLDPMCGAGTTAIACARMNRKAIICDRSEEYTALTAERLRTQLAGDPHLRAKYTFKNSNTILFSDSEVS